jgi:hypothetical protein
VIKWGEGAKMSRFHQRSKSKFRHWFINLLILVIVTILMLLLGEGFLRWLDGFQFSSLKLEPDQTTTIQR